MEKNIYERILTPFVPMECEARVEGYERVSKKIMRVLHIALLSFLFLICPQASAMLGEGSFVGTGGYAIGLTPYYYAGLSYYYDPEMDYKWDGQQWISQTGAQWPARCCKPNPCSSCGYRQMRECSNYDECSSTIQECVEVYKNHNF